MCWSAPAHSRMSLRLCSKLRSAEPSSLTPPALPSTGRPLPCRHTGTSSVSHLAAYTHSFTGSTDSLAGGKIRPDWSEMSRRLSDWSGMSQRYPDWSEMSRRLSDWSGMGQRHPDWSEMSREQCKIGIDTEAAQSTRQDIGPISLTQSRKTAVTFIFIYIYMSTFI